MKKAQRAVILPVQFGVMNCPGKSQPPLYEVSNYAMEHFGELLKLVAWADKEFGAIQVRFQARNLKRIAAGGRETLKDPLLSISFILKSKP